MDSVRGTIAVWADGQRCLSAPLTGRTYTDMHVTCAEIYLEGLRRSCR